MPETIHGAEWNGKCPYCGSIEIIPKGQKNRTLFRCGSFRWSDGRAGNARMRRTDSCLIQQLRRALMDLLIAHESESLVEVTAEAARDALLHTQ